MGNFSMFYPLKGHDREHLRIFKLYRMYNKIIKYIKKAIDEIYESELFYLLITFPSF